MQHGYRVFAVELHDGGKREAQPFGEAKVPVTDATTGKPTGTSHQYDYRDVVVADIEAHPMKTFDFGITEAEYEETGPAQAKGMAIRFVKGVRDGELVKFEFEQGVQNADGTLIVDGADVQMKNRPTLHPYRALLFAETDGKIALLAVEVRGRSCPSDAVVRGLKSCSEVPWRLQVLAHLAGEAAMRTFLQNATIKRVVFDRWTFDDDGQRDRNEVSMAVTADGVDVRSRMDEWADEFFARVPKLDRQATVEVPEYAPDGSKRRRKDILADRKRARNEAKLAKAEELKAKQEFRSTAPHRTHAAAESLRQDIFMNRDERVEVDFNAVAVELDDGRQHRKITPTTDFTKFTYVLGDGYISDDRFYDDAEATLRELLPSIKPLPLS